MFETKLRITIRSRREVKRQLFLTTQMWKTKIAFPPSSHPRHREWSRKILSAKIDENKLSVIICSNYLAFSQANAKCSRKFVAESDERDGEMERERQWKAFSRPINRLKDRNPFYGVGDKNTNKLWWFSNLLKLFWCPSC